MKSDWTELPFSLATTICVFLFIFFYFCSMQNLKHWQNGCWNMPLPQVCDLQVGRIWCQEQNLLTLLNIDKHFWVSETTTEFPSGWALRPDWPLQITQRFKKKENIFSSGNCWILEKLQLQPHQTYIIPSQQFLSIAPPAKIHMLVIEVFPCLSGLQTASKRSSYAFIETDHSWMMWLFQLTSYFVNWLISIH